MPTLCNTKFKKHITSDKKNSLISYKEYCRQYVDCQEKICMKIITQTMSTYASGSLRSSYNMVRKRAASQLITEGEMKRAASQLITEGEIKRAASQLITEGEM